MAQNPAHIKSAALGNGRLDVIWDPDVCWETYRGLKPPRIGSHPDYTRALITSGIIGEAPWPT